MACVHLPNTFHFDKNVPSDPIACQKDQLLSASHDGSSDDDSLDTSSNGSSDERSSISSDTASSSDSRNAGCIGMEDLCWDAYQTPSCWLTTVTKNNVQHGALHFNDTLRKAIVSVISKHHSTCSAESSTYSDNADQENDTLNFDDNCSLSDCVCDDSDSTHGATCLGVLRDDTAMDCCKSDCGIRDSEPLCSSQSYDDCCIPADDNDNICVDMTTMAVSTTSTWLSDLVFKYISSPQLFDKLQEVFVMMTREMQSFMTLDCRRIDNHHHHKYYTRSSVHRGIEYGDICRFQIHMSSKHSKIRLEFIQHQHGVYVRTNLCNARGVSLSYLISTALANMTMDQYNKNIPDDRRYCRVFKNETIYSFSIHGVQWRSLAKFTALFAIDPTSLLTTQQLLRELHRFYTLVDQHKLRLPYPHRDTPNHILNVLQGLCVLEKFTSFMQYANLPQFTTLSRDKHDQNLKTIVIAPQKMTLCTDLTAILFYEFNAPRHVKHCIQSSQKMPLPDVNLCHQKYILGQRSVTQTRFELNRHDGFDAVSKRSHISELKFVGMIPRHPHDLHLFEDDCRRYTPLLLSFSDTSIDEMHHSFKMKVFEDEIAAIPIVHNYIIHRRIPLENCQLIQTNWHEQTTNNSVDMITAAWKCDASRVVGLFLYHNHVTCIVLYTNANNALEGFSIMCMSAQTSQQKRQKVKILGPVMLTRPATRWSYKFKINESDAMQESHSDEIAWISVEHVVNSDFKVIERWSVKTGLSPQWIVGIPRYRTSGITLNKDITYESSAFRYYALSTRSNGNGTSTKQTFASSSSSSSSKQYSNTVLQFAQKHKLTHAAKGILVYKLCRAQDGKTVLLTMYVPPNAFIAGDSYDGKGKFRVSHCMVVDIQPIPKQALEVNTSWRPRDSPMLQALMTAERNPDLDIPEIEHVACCMVCHADKTDESGLWVFYKSCDHGVCMACHMNSAKADLSIGKHEIYCPTCRQPSTGIRFETNAPVSHRWIGPNQDDALHPWCPYVRAFSFMSAFKFEYRLGGTYYCQNFDLSNQRFASGFHCFLRWTELIKQYLRQAVVVDVPLAPYIIDHTRRKNGSAGNETPITIDEHVQCSHDNPRLVASSSATKETTRETIAVTSSSQQQQQQQQPLPLPIDASNETADHLPTGTFITINKLPCDYKEDEAIVREAMTPLDLDLPNMGTILSNQRLYPTLIDDDDNLLPTENGTKYVLTPPAAESDDIAQILREYAPSVPLRQLAMPLEEASPYDTALKSIAYTPENLITFSTPIVPNDNDAHLDTLIDLFDPSHESMVSMDHHEPINLTSTLPIASFASTPIHENVPPPPPYHTIIARAPSDLLDMIPPAPTHPLANAVEHDILDNLPPAPTHVPGISALEDLPPPPYHTIVNRKKQNDCQYASQVYSNYN